MSGTQGLSRTLARLLAATVLVAFIVMVKAVLADDFQMPHSGSGQDWHGNGGNHLGRDMGGSIGEGVKAISDIYELRIEEQRGYGVYSFLPSFERFEKPGKVVLAKHRLQDGKYFWAVYGHVIPAVGAVQFDGKPKIKGGTVIATIADFWYIASKKEASSEKILNEEGKVAWKTPSPHLHFGIWNNGSPPSPPTGYGADRSFVNPLPWLTNQYKPYDSQATNAQEPISPEHQKNRDKIEKWRKIIPRLSDIEQYSKVPGWLKITGKAISIDYEQYYQDVLKYHALALKGLEEAEKLNEGGDSSSAKTKVEKAIEDFQTHQDLVSALIDLNNAKLEEARKVLLKIYKIGKYSGQIVDKYFHVPIFKGLYFLSDFAIDWSEYGIDGAAKEQAKKIVSGLVTEAMLNLPVHDMPGMTYKDLLDATKAQVSAPALSLLKEKLGSSEYTEPIVSYVISKGIDFISKDQLKKLVTKFFDDVVKDGSHQVATSSVPQTVRQAFERARRSEMGTPRNEVHKWQECWLQDFDNPRGALILKGDSGTPYWVHGAIWARYQTDGEGAPQKYGYPISEERDGAPSPQGTTGRFQRFEKGSFEWLQNRNHTVWVPTEWMAWWEEASGGKYSGWEHGWPVSDVSDGKLKFESGASLSTGGNLQGAGAFPGTSLWWPSPGNLLERFCLAIMRYEGWEPGSPSVRNNNPGNLRSSSHVSNTPVEGGFVRFATPQDGWSALVWDVRQKCLDKTVSRLSGDSTILDFCRIWAPQSDRNDPDSYARFLALETGLTVDTKLAVLLGGTPQSAVVPRIDSIQTEPVTVVSGTAAGTSGEFVLTITGSGFDPTAAVDQIRFPNGFVGSGVQGGGLVEPITPNRIMVKQRIPVPPADPGVYHVSVKNGPSPEQSSNEITFTIFPATASGEAYSAELLGSPPSLTLAPGQSTAVTLRFKNTGSVTWNKYGEHPVHLGTQNPQDRSSDFFDQSWLSLNRAALLKEETVRPGEVGTFEFQLTAPSNKSGNFQEHFLPVAENASWVKSPSPVFVATAVVQAPLQIASGTPPVVQGGTTPGTSGDFDITLNGSGIDPATVIDTVYGPTGIKIGSAIESNRGNIKQATSNQIVIRHTMPVGPSSSLPAGRYFITLKNGPTGPESNQFEFTITAPVPVLPLAPTLITPGAPGEPGPSLPADAPIMLQWSGVPEATRYGVYISIAPYGEANQVFKNDEQTTSTSFPVPPGTLQPGQKYRWKVAAFNGAGQYKLSEPLYFVVTAPTSVAPTITSVSPPSIQGGTTPGTSADFNLVVSGGGFDPNTVIDTVYGPSGNRIGSAIESNRGNIIGQATSNHIVIRHTMPVGPSSSLPAGRYFITLKNGPTGPESNQFEFTINTPVAAPLQFSANVTTVTKGEVIQEQVSGATPGGRIQLYWIPPGQPQQGPADKGVADGNGSLQLSWPTESASYFGTYTSWVVDTATGRESNRLQLTINPPASSSPSPQAISVTYEVHIAYDGWLARVQNGQTAGTPGQGKQIEAMKISVSNYGVEYQAHVAHIGWQNWVSDGAQAGTTGEQKGIEAVRIKLKNPPPGASIIYRVYVRNQGWGGWISNGETAGTTGQGLPIEGIEIKVQ